MGSILVGSMFPWCFIGGFNSILGAHEHFGLSSPNSTPMSGFFALSNHNKLVYIPNIGSFFTWSNGRSEVTHILRKLDIGFFFQSWFNIFSVISWVTTTKFCSDHYPIMFESKVGSSSFISQLKLLKMWTLHEGCKEFIEDC